jgi:hypothetical protein
VSSRTIIALIALPLLTGCTMLNAFKGPGDHWRNYMAGDLKEGIDDSIQGEINKQLPNGYLRRQYSRAVWDEYWNWRIHHLYDIGTTEVDQAYRGPSGPEWIRYIITARRSHGLPELKIEPRNRDKVPQN